MLTLAVEFYNVLWKEHSILSLIWRPGGGLVLALSVCPWATYCCQRSHVFTDDFDFFCFVVFVIKRIEKTPS